jgi:hypothetical protein
MRSRGVPGFWQAKRKEAGHLESNEGSIGYNGDHYVLVGRERTEDHVLVAGDVLALAVNGRHQACRVAHGRYRGWYYVTDDGQRARFALCMKARLLASGVYVMREVCD